MLAWLVVKEAPGGWRRARVVMGLGFVAGFNGSEDDGWHGWGYGVC